MSDAPAKTFRLTGAGDFVDLGAGVGAIGQCLGARLVAGAAAAAVAQIVDQDGAVLYDLAAVQGSSDEALIPVRFVRKISLGTLTGAGAAATVYIA